MLVYKHIPFSFLIRLNWKYLLFVLGLGSATWYLSTVLVIHNPTVLLPSVTVFGAILSIFLAFRTNEAYSRWWEARILWGQLVNTSRSLAREVIAYLHRGNLQQPDSQEMVTQRIIYRHLAFINALRLHLRGEDGYDAELGKYLSKEELNTVLEAANKPTKIVANQSKDISEQYIDDGRNSFEYVQLNTTLNKLYDIQGGCERIKNTVFPRMYAYYTTTFTWVFSTLLIISLVDEFEWQTMLVRMLVAYVFLVLDNLGRRLKNPFENQVDDTPMSALCRTIEIDLREMLGEKHDLQPLSSRKGILN